MAKVTVEISTRPFFKINVSRLNRARLTGPRGGGEDLPPVWRHNVKTYRRRIPSGGTGPSYRVTTLPPRPVEAISLSFYGLQTHLSNEGTVASLGSGIRRKSAASGQWGMVLGSGVRGQDPSRGGVLGSGVRGQDPSRPVGYLAVGCIENGQVPSGLGGVLGSGVRGQDPSMGG